VNGPTKTLVPTLPREEQRLPEDRDAFHRHDTRRSWFLAKGSLPSAFTPALSLTPPTLDPELGKVLLMGIARSRCGHPRIRGSSRVQVPFLLVGTSAPGTDDPSTPPSSTSPAVDEDRLPRSHRCQSRRLDGFYDRELAASTVRRPASRDGVRTQARQGWCFIGRLHPGRGRDFHASHLRYA
jgi:hypothetical protein